MSAQQGALKAWALALALIVLCLPIHSPDLFWHLSAGRWIWANGSIPFSDSFTFTKFGAPWIDFEWLAQLLLYSADRAGGFIGLWLLKGVLLVAAFWPVDGLMRDKGAPAEARAAGLALWLCAVLPAADLRVDLISAGFLALILRRLESGRASFLFGFALFALWTNVHAAFPLGLLLYAGYFLMRRGPHELGAELCGALLGSMLNPYGLKIWLVIAAHGGDSIGAFVQEWGPVDWRVSFHRPLIAALLAAGVAVRSGRKHAPVLAAVAGVLLFATVLSSRFCVYFAAAGAALFAIAVRPRLVAGALAAATVLLALSTGRVAWGRSFSDVYVARRAADFVASERAALGGLRLFNTYEWGGYLGWKIGPEGKVFGDGRYLFHGQLPELQYALSGAGPMGEFVERYRLDGLLIKNDPARMNGEMIFPDGARATLSRPWYASYLPRARWALAYWDEQALLFVDRAKVPAAWLAAHECKWVRPGDGEALAAALAHGLVKPPEVEAERARCAR